MMKPRNGFIKNLHYLCLIGVIAVGLMTIIGTGGGGGGGGEVTTTEGAEPNILSVPSEYSTIQKAIDAAGEGDTIRIAAGTYNEQGLEVFGGLTIEGESAESTIIRGFRNDDIIEDSYYSDNTKPIVIKRVTIENGYTGIALSDDILELTDCIVRNNKGQSSGVYLSHRSVATISNCEIADNSGDGIAWGTATISNSFIKNNTGSGVSNTNATISNCEIADNSGDGISGGADATISNSAIRNNTGTGVSAGTVTISNSVIKDNTGIGISGVIGTIANTIIANNAGDGIDLSYDMDISSCTIYGNDDGIYASLSSGTIKNSILTMNTNDGIHDFYSSLNLSNINFYGNSDCNWKVDGDCYEGSDLYDAIDSILTDPMFVDAANGDFQLQEGSPALTASDTGGEIGAYGNGGNPPD